MDTMYLPTGPTNFSKAAMVRLRPDRATPFSSTVPSIPEDAMTRPVMEQMTIVSKKVPVELI